MIGAFSLPGHCRCRPMFRRSTQTVLTRTASVSGLRPRTGKATRRIPWTGTTRRILQIFCERLDSV